MVTKEQVYNWLEEVSDPEIPVLSVIDLGVVRDAQLIEGEWLITITPTYSGCPAMKTMEEDILSKLKEKGIDSAHVELVLAPAWSTDWLSENGRIKLREYGIAPPEHEVDKSVLFAEPTVVPCPKCHSRNTRMVSQFGSTACKALYQCNDCQEPYDYFKCLK
ncbi:MAG: phenylacetate-CoA oxygenase subunit PaaJ [Flavobacteriales bacterium]|nr:phenylacetate-CoA oxygenase subunit PaaJ [Flavobacteriales bacterium]